MKKLLALALVLCLALSAVPALALDLLPAGDTYPIKTDKVITWYNQDNIIPHEKFASVDESPFHLGLEKIFGVDIDWSFPTTGADGNTITQALLADPSNLPDIMGAYFSSNASQYIDDEIIWDLTDYLPEYAPAYWHFLQTHPDYDKAMKTDDGKYYSFGFFREDGGWNDTYQGPVVRTDWLKECNLEIPKTISEFENVIRVFNQKYGAKFDSAYGPRWAACGLAGSFGSYANATTGNSWYVKDGKVGFAQADDSWRNYMSWLAGLWADGLIDQDILSEDDTTIKTKVHNDLCGIALTSMGQMNNWNKERMADGKEAVWMGIPYPTDEDGNITSVFGGLGIGDKTNVITRCADEETMKICLQLLDYAFTAEGFLYWNYGEENVSWVMGDDGVPQFTALVNDDTDTDPMTKYNGTTWGREGIQATNLLYLKNSEAAIAANDTWFYLFGKDEYFADSAVYEKTLDVTGRWRYPVSITYTTAESDELDMIGVNLSTYVEQSYAEFLNGTKNINDDAVWQDHLKNLESYKLSRILEIRQAAYDRYAAR